MEQLGKRTNESAYQLRITRTLSFRYTQQNTFKGNHPTPKLKSHSEEGIIVLDEETTLKRNSTSKHGIIN